MLSFGEFDRITFWTDEFFAPYSNLVISSGFLDPVPVGLLLNRSEPLTLLVYFTSLGTGDLVFASLWYDVEALWCPQDFLLDP